MSRKSLGKKSLAVTLCMALFLSVTIAAGFFGSSGAAVTKGPNLLKATISADTAISQDAADQMEDFELWHVEGSSTQEPKPTVADMFDRWFYNKTVTTNIFGDDSNKTPAGNVSLHFGSRSGGTAFDQENKRPSLWVAAEIESGKTYVVEAWVKTGVLHDENHGVRIAYATFNQQAMNGKAAAEDGKDPWVFTDNTNITCDGSDFSGCTMLKDDDGNVLTRPVDTWKKMSATFTAGEDTDAVMLRLYTNKINTAAEGWLGDVGVYEVTEDNTPDEPAGNLFKAPFTENFVTSTDADDVMKDFEAWHIQGKDGQPEDQWPKVADAFNRWYYSGYLYEAHLYRDAQMMTPDGSASMHLGYKAGASDLDEEPKRASVYTAGKIEAGKTYEISMWVKTSAVYDANHGLRVAYGTFSTAANNTKFISLQGEDDVKEYTGSTQADIENIDPAFAKNIGQATADDFAKLTLLKDADGKTLISTADENAAWKKVSVVFTAAEGSDAVMLRIYSNKINMAASAWVGDITLKEYTGKPDDDSKPDDSSAVSSEDDQYPFPPAGENLINGDLTDMKLFDLGAGLSYKTFFKDELRWGVYPYLDFVTTDTAVLSPAGKASAKISVDPDEELNYNRAICVTPIEPFKTYHVSFKAKWKDVEKAYFEYRVYYGIDQQLTTDIVPTVATVAI